MFVTKLSNGVLLRHTATSNVGVFDIARAHLRWFEDPRFDGEVPVLWDCRDHVLNTSLVDLSELDRYTISNTRSRRKPGSRSALLVSSALTQAALEATILTNPHFVAEFKVFTEEPDALAWLGVAG